MAVLAEPVEELVRARVLADLADDDEMAELARRERAVHDARAAAAAEVARLEDMLAELEAKLAAETIREHAYEAAKAVYDRRIADAEAKRDALAAPAPAGKLPATTAAEYDVLSRCGAAGADRPAAAGGHRAAAAAGRAAQHVRPGAGRRSGHDSDPDPVDGSNGTRYILGIRPTWTPRRIDRDPPKMASR